MGLLGDFLEAFYGNGQAFQTVRAKLRREYNSVTHKTKSPRSPIIGKQKSSSPPSNTIAVEMDIWSIVPGHARVDETRTKNRKTESTVEITKGLQRLKRTAEGDVEISSESPRQQDGDLLPTDYRRHFDRGLIREFFAFLELQDAGACKVAGRDCVRINAVPVPGDRIWPHWLPYDADRFEFAADLEFPSLLSISGLLSGEIIERIYVVDIAFNENLDENIFDCAPLEGQTIRPAEPITQQVTLDAAIAKVPFTVLLPGRRVGVETPELHYAPGRASGDGESVMAMYVGNGANRFWFKMRAKPDPELGESLEWTELEESGQKLEISDPETDGGMIVLRFCKNGTWIEIFSDYPLKDLLEIATSFEPV